MHFFNNSSLFLRIRVRSCRLTQCSFSVTFSQWEQRNHRMTTFHRESEGGIEGMLKAKPYGIDVSDGPRRCKQQLRWRREGCLPVCYFFARVIACLTAPCEIFRCLCYMNRPLSRLQILLTHSTNCFFLLI